MQLLVPFLAPAAVTVVLAAVALPPTTADVTTAPPRPQQAARSGTTTDPEASAHTVPRPAGLARGLTAGWPLSPPPAIRRRFEQPRSQWSGGHRGVDLVAAVGQPVLSAGDGVVAFSGVIAGRGVITVRHRGGLRTTYEPVDERLASGTLVARGVRIGVVSPTPGHCLPVSCLHWGAISARTYQDPLALMGFGRPILLPLG